ncbi:hypothetical protein BJV78DRAFT_1181795 [Lactifluus subvellereus]|nr:hypothetical protein BJV78DRAFT_1181795 [Lactifluus subvellereus]
MRLARNLGLLFPLVNLSKAFYTPIPRWAQAAAVINDALFVYGGKTDQYNAYGYDSAPWTNDLLFLSLSTSFDTSHPPWQYVSGSQNASASSQGPTLAWHSLSAFNSSFCLIFGGNTGPLFNAIDNYDSAGLLNVHNRAAPTFLSLPEGWAAEPRRRMRHATASINGKVYIIGGEAADGSGNAFSTHYVFIPSIPTFIQLPTENAPPGLIGHAAIILFDGRLLVFGGISQGQLVSFGIIWVLDTGQTNPTWTQAVIDESNLPSPRTSFAVVLLDDGRILIHGGTDTAYLSNFADGWILDPSTNPMTWTAVPALSQLGPRRDHFAASAGDQVVFGFGYGNNAPADAPVHVYDVCAGTFQPTFQPMVAPPAHKTLPPDPVQSVGAPGPLQIPGNSLPGQSGVIPSRTTQPPSSTSTGGAGGPGNTGGPRMSGRRRSKLLAIVIGSVLGVLTSVAASAATVWYVRQRRARSGPAFSPLDVDDSDHTHSITALRIAGMGEKGPRILAVPRELLTMLGLGRSRNPNRSRRDILADEDRSFYLVRSRDVSRANSSFGGPSAPGSIRGWSNAVSDGIASLRGLARGVSSAPRSREPSTNINWEKLGGDPFSAEVTLMAEGLSRDDLPERIPHPYAMAGPSQSYTDPFSDRDTSSEALHEYNPYDPEPEIGPEPARSEPRYGEVRRRQTPLLTSLPPSADFVPLSPLVEQPSQNSLSNSSSSLNTHSDPHTGSGSSHAVSPRPSSILDPNPPTSQPIRRSNSWWARFAKPSLLERRSTDSSARNSGGFIDFRDPNPPPRVLTEEFAHSRLSDIPEGTASRSPSTNATLSRAYSGTHTRKLSLYRDTSHGKSASSLQTANTETLERLGGTMDIIQRDATLDSHFTSPTTASADDEFGPGPSSTSPPNSGILRRLMVRGEPSHWSTGSSTESPMVLSPLASGAASPTRELTEPTSPERETPTPTPAAPSSSEDLMVAPGTSPAGGDDDGTTPTSPGVADRVRAFERRMSREIEPPPAPTNTRHREERTTPRPVVRYGLVPRPSLFVANPDGSRGSDG